MPIMAAFIIKSKSIQICQTRTIQSGEKNAQIILAVMGVVILFRAPQTTPSFKSKQTMPEPAPGNTNGRG